MNTSNPLEEIKNEWLQHRLIAYVVVLSAIFAFSLNLLKDAIEAWNRFVPRAHYYAQDLADEYYILVDKLEKPEEAITLRRKLVELSYLSTKLEVESNARSQRGDYGLFSSTIAIGFDPDMVLYAKDDQEKGKWIVAIDPVSGQGDFKPTLDSLATIRRRLDHIKGEYQSSPEAPLMKLALEVEPLFADAKVLFFDAVAYEQNYGEFNWSER